MPSCFDPIAELSRRLSSLDQLEPLIDDLHSRQKYLLQLIELKTQEHRSSQAQYRLHLQEALKQLQAVLARCEEAREAVGGCAEGVVGCTAGLYALDMEKAALLRSISQEEQVEMLRHAVGLLEECLYTKTFARAVHALDAVGELRDALSDVKSAQPWLQKAQTTVPLVLSASAELLKRTLQDARPVDQTACNVLAKDGHALDEFVHWTAMFFLRDYEAVYGGERDGSGEMERLASLGSRLEWLSRVLRKADNCGLPAGWSVSLAVMQRFAAVTREAISRAVSLEDSRSLSAALKAAVKYVRNYERHLRHTIRCPFPEDGFLLPAFLPYLRVIVDEWEERLQNYTESLFHTANGSSNGTHSGSKKKSPRQRGDKLFPLQQDDRRVICQSAEHLFQMFRSALDEVKGLCSGAALVELMGVFDRSLKHYSSHLASLSQCLSSRCDVVTVESACVLINTADYLIDGVHAMQGHIRLELEHDEAVAQQIDLSLKAAIATTIHHPFEQLLNTVVGQLAGILAGSFTAVWEEFRRGDVGRLKECSDQSAYTHTLISTLLSPSFAQVRKLVSFPDRHRWVCESFVSLLMEQYEGAVWRGRPIGSIGAEQLLIDLNTVRPVLLSLDPSQVYRVHCERLVQSMERKFKILLHDARDPEQFAVHYYLMSDGDGREDRFRRTLEIKGVRSTAGSTATGTFAARERFLEAFRRHQPLPPSYPRPGTCSNNNHHHSSDNGKNNKSIRSTIAHLFN